MVTAIGWDMYEPRTTLKAVAVETIEKGESVYIHTDGLVYVVDNTKSDVCHGWALEAAAAGDYLTIVTEGRLNIVTTQTIGARVYTGNVAGGSAPSTTLAAVGVICGYAVTANLVALRVVSPAADG